MTFKGVPNAIFDAFVPRVSPECLNNRTIFQLATESTNDSFPCRIGIIYQDELGIETRHDVLIGAIIGGSDGIIRIVAYSFNIKSSIRFFSDRILGFFDNTTGLDIVPNGFNINPREFRRLVFLPGNENRDSRLYSVDNIRDHCRDEITAIGWDAQINKTEWTDTLGLHRRLKKGNGYLKFATINLIHCPIFYDWYNGATGQFITPGNTRLRKWALAAEGFGYHSFENVSEVVSEFVKLSRDLKT